MRSLRVIQCMTVCVLVGLLVGCSKTFNTVHMSATPTRDAGWVLTDENQYIWWSPYDAAETRSIQQQIQYERRYGYPGMDEDQYRNAMRGVVK